MTKGDELDGDSEPEEGEVERVKREVVTLDGTEGGGQVLRIALSVSALTQQAVKIENIRASRPTPGLSFQLLHTLNLIADLCTAERLSGNTLRSTTVEIHPLFTRGEQLASPTGGEQLASPTGGEEVTSPTGGEGSLQHSLMVPLSFPPPEVRRLRCTATTAASVWLMMDCLLLPLALSGTPTLLTLGGGTDVDFAPPTNYVLHAYLPTLQRMGVEVKEVSLKRGYFPKGGGEVELRVEPCERLRPINMTERGEVTQIDCYIETAGKQYHPIGVELKRLITTEVKRSELDGVSWESLRHSFNVQHTALSREMAAFYGGSVALIAHTASGCVLTSDLTIPSRLQGDDVAAGIAKAVVDKLRVELSHGGCVCEHLQDALILPMCMATGTSQLLSGPLTDHSRYAIEVITRLLPAVRIDVKDSVGSGDTVMIEVSGQPASA